MIARLRRLLPWLRAVIGLGLFLSVLLWADWSAILESLSRAQVSWIALGVLSVLVGLGVKAVRWELLLRAVDVRVRPLRVLRAYLSGQAVNIMLPFRGGELVRLGMIGVDASERVPEAGSSILAEKGLDALALVALVGGLLWTLPSERLSLALGHLHLPVLPVLLAAAALAALAFIAWPKLYTMFEAREHPVWSLLERTNKVLARWHTWVRSPSQAFIVALLTCAAWMVMWATNLIVFRAVNLPLGGSAAALVLALVMAGVVPALMPANLGPFHFFALLALQAFAVDIRTALAFAVLLHAVVTLPTLFLGGALLLLPGGRVALAEGTREDEFQATRLGRKSR